jgi:hypothetical protein
MTTEHDETRQRRADLFAAIGTLTDLRDVALAIHLSAKATAARLDELGATTGGASPRGSAPSRQQLRPSRR